VVAGFEPGDILQAVAMLVAQLETERPGLENAYPRAVTEEGNLKAQHILTQVFQVGDACWRGIGRIPESGLQIRETYAAYDAGRRFVLHLPEPKTPRGCACGEILTGQKTPPECALYKKVCTPIDPVGPCMVSSEGTCAAYYRYHYDEFNAQS
jgi:hydrogenase expression/formation protein HypD